ncbi:MAG: hypothetical protein JRF33_07150 [Deltaproteobacteria bacterium]|nr:hypothetical protein [Deltaproteobacteria bacterium]
MRWLTLPLALSGLLLLSACPCDRGQSEVFHEDFESWCEGVPCGWELAAGQVERSTSYHAGEHGAQLSGGARLLVELDGVLLAATEYSDYLIFMIRCDLEAGLRFTLEVEGEEGSYPLVVELPVGAGFGSEIMQMNGLELPAREGERRRPSRSCAWIWSSGARAPASSTSCACSPATMSAAWVSLPQRGAQRGARRIVGGLEGLPGWGSRNSRFLSSSTG